MCLILFFFGLFDAFLKKGVQYYCLTSAAGSWTDFHVDFGGTSGK